MPDLGVTTEKSVHVSAEVAADTFEIYKQLFKITTCNTGLHACTYLIKFN